MPHGRIGNNSAAGDSRIAVADQADTTLETTRTRRHSSGAPGTFSGLGPELLLGWRDPMESEDRPSQAPLVRTWQRCRETPTDNDVWEELFQRLSPALGGIISRTMRRWGLCQRADIDDLVQDTGLKILQLSRSSRHLPNDEAKLYGYFRSVAANTALTWIRQRFTEKRNVHETVPLVDHLSLLIGEIKPGQSLEHKVLVREMDKLLGCPPRDRNVFWLYYRQGLTAAEIAAIPAIGLSIKGVESLIHRMRADLRQRME
jgi:RNA polymerase sigma-70 factor (ECF subfamily)